MGHNIEDPFKDENFADDHELLPPTNIGHVFSYILLKKAFEAEYIGQYKARKAYSFYKSGFVDKLYLLKGSNDRTIIKSKCIPSQRINEKKHELWFIINSGSGEVVSSYCTCTAGLAESCNHVIAALYKLEFANEYINSLPSTSLPCGWNEPARSDFTPRKVVEIDFVRHNTENKNPKHKLNNDRVLYDPRPIKYRTVTDDRKDFYIATIRKEFPKAVVNNCFTPPPTLDMPPPLPVIAENLLKSHRDHDFYIIQQFNAKLSFNDSQLNELEKATRFQSNSSTWWEQRKGRITASKFHEVNSKVRMMAKSKTTKMTPLVLSLCEPKKISAQPLTWGKTKEKVALEAFMKVEGIKHTKSKLLSSGLYVYKSNPFLGATPDGIFTCKCKDCEGRVCVEVKCPHSLKEGSISEGETYKKLAYLEMIDGEIKLKKNHAYYAQVTGQMAITGIQSTFFVVWTPKGPPLILKIAFDQDYWLEILPNLSLFFKSYVCPYLLCIKKIFHCPVCSEICLSDEESEKEVDKCFRCEQCYLWFHKKCCTEGSENVCLYCCENEE